jgi:hypothetical protein
VDLAAAEVPGRRSVELAGPERVTLRQVIEGYRAWLGFGQARILALPDWAVRPALAFGDAVAWLGWSSSMRTTSLRQLQHDAAGAGDPTPGARPFSEFLNDEPAGVQDRWHARLFFVRPLSVIVLGLFWLFSGLVDLGPGAGRADAVLLQAGLGRWAHPVAYWGGWLDVVLAAFLFVRRTAMAAVLAMLAVTVGYLASATLFLPQLWTDPLGPWLKVFPMMALSLVVLATDARR